MKNIIKTLICIVLFSSISFTQSNPKNDNYRLFYLGGQSNMDGYGYYSELPDSLKEEFNNVWIFHGNSVPDNKVNGGLGLWTKLRPGHGTGFSSNGKINSYSDRFGVELSFVRKLQKLFPGEKIAIIKYSRGGTSIDSLAAGSAGCWEPDFKKGNGINQYDHFNTTLKNAFADKDINNDGKEDVLVPSGIIWMQGESDAYFSEEIANRYYYNLSRLIGLMRTALFTDDLPIVIGKISDSWNDEDGKVWDYGELVQYAQEKFVKNDKNAAIIRSTRYYKYSDTWHYDSEGYIDLGEKFAEAIFKLIKNKQN